MRYRHIKIPVQKMTQAEADKVSEFLKKQPRWHYPKPDEYEDGRGYKTKRGVTQHWLWQDENQATSWDAFIMEWGTHSDPHWITVDRKHLIMPGELFLCDLVGGELWVGRLELRAGEFKAEKLFQISDDMNRDYGNCFNGYAVIPEITGVLGVDDN